MSKAEKKINKWLIGAIIGTTLIGAGGLSMTPKGQSFWQRIVKRCEKTGAFLARLFFKKSKKKKRKLKL